MGMNEAPVLPTTPTKPLLKRMADPDIVFYLVPWLMVLLTAGTIAQKDLGLYQAQEIYFSSWILWLGPIPLPGAYATLGLLTICLATKFIFYSPWRWDRAGTILTHLGILLLLGGGILTALTQAEGYLSLREGQTGNAISDYHNRVLRIEKEGALLSAIPFDGLVAGTRIVQADIPFRVTPISLCKNCRPAPVKDPRNRRGLAEQMALSSAPDNKEAETNLSGVTLQFTGLPGEQDGLYIAMEEIPHIPSVTMDGTKFEFFMRREERILPFSIELVDFQQKFHPGTATARAYSSDIIVHDGNINWPAKISMNEPLRYKGYTVYQASFIEKPDGEYTVLSIVRNQGRAFPYIASLLIFAGLLLHILIRLGVQKRWQS